MGLPTGQKALRWMLDFDPAMWASNRQTESSLDALKDSKMSQSASYYPVAQLIARIIRNSGLSRSQFIQSLGYRNVEKGLRRLDAWLDNADGHRRILNQIATTYPGHSNELETALTETAEVHGGEHVEAVKHIEERERRRFKPFIWVHTADGAHSVLSALAERQVKTLWLADGFQDLSWSDKMAIVQRRVRDHHREMGGECRGFGQILQYRFADTFDTSIVLDTQGDVIETDSGRFLLPEVRLSLQ